MGGILGAKIVHQVLVHDHENPLSDITNKRFSALANITLYKSFEKIKIVIIFFQCTKQLLTLEMLQIRFNNNQAKYLREI